MQSIVSNVMNVEDTIFFVICVKGERSQNNNKIPSTSILLKQKNLWFSFEKKQEISCLIIDGEEIEPLNTKLLEINISQNL